MLWICAIFKFIGGFLLILYLSIGTFYIIDWEQNDTKNSYLNHQRRTVICNEWIKLSKLRSTSLSFTLILIVFIMEGLNVKLYTSSIPSIELVNNGENYEIIKVGLTSFIWIIITIVFWLVKRLIWKCSTNPFHNFRNLCISLNISVFIMKSNTYGFLIHGKNKNMNNLTIDDSYDYDDGSDTEIVDEKSITEEKNSIELIVTKGSKKSGNDIKLTMNNKEKDKSIEKSSSEHIEISIVSQRSNKSDKETHSTNVNESNKENIKDKTNENFNTEHSEKSQNSRRSNKSVKETQINVNETNKEIINDKTSKNSQSELINNSQASLKGTQSSSKSKSNLSSHEINKKEINSTSANTEKLSTKNNSNTKSDSTSQDTDSSTISVSLDVDSPKTSDVGLISSDTSYTQTINEEEEEEYESYSESNQNIQNKFEYEYEDTLPIIEPLPQSKNSGISFEVMFDPDFFYYIKKHEEKLFGLTDEDEEESSMESISDEFEMFNNSLKDFLNKKDKIHQYKIEEMNVGNKVFGIKPVPLGESIFIKCSKSNFANSMLNGIEITLSILSLSLFTCLSYTFHSDCISALIVYIIDLVFIKFYLLLRKKYLYNRKYDKIGYC